MRVLLIGSEFMLQLQKYATNITVVDVITGYNPLGDEICAVIKNSVKKHRPDAVVVDLMMCGSWLYKTFGDPVIRTLTDPENSAKEIFNPAVFRFSKFDSNFNSFVRLLVELFSKENIFLVESACPRFFVIKNQLRNMSKAPNIKPWKSTFKMLKKREGRFIKLSNSKVISLSKYYFVKKRPGREVLFTLFEDELYEDINRWFLENEAGIEREAPSYDLSVKRYINYQYKTIHYKAFTAFLDKEDFTDNLLQTSSRDYVIKHEQDFIGLKKWAENKSVEEIENEIVNEQRFDKEFCKIVCGFAHIMQLDIGDTDVKRCYDMFRNGIVSSKVKTDLRKFWNEKGINRNIINSHNAGYYYAKMLGLEEKNAVEFAEKGYSLSPILMDVYGSCVAYNPINEFISGCTELAHNNYYMHVPCYESSSAPVEHQDVPFDEPPINEFEKNVRIQFEHQIEADLKLSDGEWCLVDLFSFIAPRTFMYNDFCFTDYGNKTWKLFSAEKFKCWEGYYQGLFKKKEFLQKIDTWIKWLNEKYGNKIITVNFRVSEVKIGDDDKIYYGYTDGRKKDELIQTIYPYIKAKLNGYFLEFPREFVSDDVGYSSSSPVHYELVYYSVVKDAIEYIVSKQPTRKSFNLYSNNVRVERMLRLRKENEPEILFEYFKKPLDHIILSLPYEFLEKYRNEIVEFYDDGLTTVQEVIEKVKKMRDNGSYWLEQLIDELGDLDIVKEDLNVIEKLPQGYICNSEQMAQKKYRDFLAENIIYKIEYYCNDVLICEQKAIFGVKSRIMENPEPERNFIGWKVIRESDQGIWCINDENVRQFRPENICEEDGYHIFLATNEHCFYKLTKKQGDVIRFYAQFAD